MSEPLSAEELERVRAFNFPLGCSPDECQRLVATIDALTAERDEALALADRIRRGMDLALEQQRERVAAAEAIVSRMEEVVSAATEVAALLAAGWEHDDDRDCVTCDAERRLAAALARLDADPPREPEA